MDEIFEKEFSDDVLNIQFLIKFQGKTYGLGFTLEKENQTYMRMLQLGEHIALVVARTLEKEGIIPA